MVAIRVEALALNQFRGQIRLTRGGNAAVEESGNIRMLQLREQADFGLEAPPELPFGQERSHDFQGDRLFERTDSTHGSINRAHASPSQKRYRAIRSERPVRDGLGR